MSAHKSLLLTSVFALLLGAPLLVGCKDGSASAQDAMYTPPASEVTVYKVQPQNVELSDALPGRVAAFRTAEIRPQVSGIVQKRLFEQGSEVEEGQIL